MLPSVRRRGGRMLLGGSPRVVYVILGAPPSLHAVHWERTLLGGVPPPWPPVSGGLPSSRSGMPCAGSAYCLTGGLPLPLCSSCAPKARLVLPLPPCLPGLGGSPPPARACHALGAHAAVQGGHPLRPGLGRMPWARAVRPPFPLARAWFARAAGAGGPRPLPGSCLPGGSRGGVLWISPRSPLRASGAHC